MALDNSEVLKNLQEQLTTVQQQVATGQATVLRLQGAIDVLSQIEESKEETTEATEEAPVDGGGEELPVEEG